jgi:signal transduction histidine kinase
MKASLGRLFGSSPSGGSVRSGHDEIPILIARLGAIKSQLDRSVHDLRGWGRALGEQLDPVAGGREQRPNPRPLGDTLEGLAHRVNTSLAAILGHAEVLLRETTDESARRRLDAIRQVALEAGATLSHLQELVAGRSSDAVGPVALHDLVGDALALTEPRRRADGERAGTRVSITREVGEALLTNGNRVELRDVFVRLILSALAEMPSGGALAIRAWGDRTWVTAEVSDTGGGARDVSHGRTVAERHGGSLEISSADGGGTTIRLRLPASGETVAPAGSAPRDRPAGPSGAFSWSATTPGCYVG